MAGVIRFAYNEEINVARIALMSAVLEFKRFSGSYANDNIVRLFTAVLNTPGALTEPATDHPLLDAIRVNFFNAD